MISKKSEGKKTVWVQKSESEQKKVMVKLVQI